MSEQEIEARLDAIEQQIIVMRDHDTLLLNACTELIHKIKAMKSPATNLCVFMTVICSTIINNFPQIINFLFSRIFS